jgi:hypothetical protein
MMIVVSLTVLLQYEWPLQKIQELKERILCIVGNAGV